MNGEQDANSRHTAPAAQGEKVKAADEWLSLELHRALIKFSGLHHQKILQAFRAGASCGKKLKKNQEKLIVLLYFEGCATPSELSRKLDLEKGGVTTLVDSLEDAGLITRGEVPGDRRKNVIMLTAEGRAYLERVLGEHQKILLNMLKKLKRAEIEELIGSLNKAIEIIERL